MPRSDEDTFMPTWDPWMTLAWLAVSLALLVLLSRWLNRHMQGVVLLLFKSANVAIYAQYLVLWPGIVLHELSHWLAAQVLGVRTKGLSLRPRKLRGGQVSYGSVQIVSADPVRNSLIGLAPLLAGSVAVLLCAAYGLGIKPLTMPASWAELRRYVTSADALIWGYLIFSISNAMLPSESDRRPWGPVALFTGIVFAFLFATNVTSKIPPSVTTVSLFVVSYLAYAFTLTIIIDGLVALGVLAFETLLSYLSGRRVKY